ncbi:hypothetical protein ACFQ68_13305 [Amycolatopsis japonica]|uniref:hypothetical protein n=1 Tax=Amycolatopsis japonica TaxID=208439 RepID=UPI00366B0998
MTPSRRLRRGCGSLSGLQTLTILATISSVITLVALGNPLWLAGLIILGALALVLGLPHVRLSIRVPADGSPLEGMA